MPTQDDNNSKVTVSVKTLTYTERVASPEFKYCNACANPSAIWTNHSCIGAESVIYIPLKGTVYNVGCQASVKKGQAMMASVAEPIVFIPDDNKATVAILQLRSQHDKDDKSYSA